MAVLGAPQLCLTALPQAERIGKVLTDTPSFIFTHHGGHSPTKMALQMVFYEFFMSLDISQREDSSGKGAASWQGNSVCLKGENPSGCNSGLPCIF